MCKILERYVNLLSDKNGLYILDVQLEYLQPYYPNWIINLQELFNKFFNQSTSEQIKQQVIINIEKLFDNYKTIHGELIISVLYPLMKEINTENNIQVVEKSIKFIGKLIKFSKDSSEFIRILEKVIVYSSDVQNSIAAVDELISCFISKWSKNAADHIIKIYTIMLKLIHSKSEIIRKKIIETLFLLKSDAQYKLYLNNIKNPYVVLESVHPNSSNSFPASDPFLTSVASEATNSILLEEQLITSSFLNFINSNKKPTMNIYLLFSKLIDQLAIENQEYLFILILDGINHMLLNNYILYGCNLDYIVNNYLIHLLTIEKFIDKLNIVNLSEANKNLIIKKSFNLSGVILLGYKDYTSRNITSALFDILVNGCCISDFYDSQIKLLCIQYLSCCCIEFPSGISHKISKIIHIIQRNLPVSNSKIYLGFISCFLNSPIKLTRMLSEKDKDSLLMILLNYIINQQSSPSLSPSLNSSNSSQSKIMVGNDLYVNIYFRYLCLFLSSCELIERQKFYHKVIQILNKENPSCPLIQSNIDLLSKVAFSDTILHQDYSENYLDNNSILFSDKDQKNTWLLGNVLLTIQIGVSGWLKTIIRRPSCYIIWVSQIQNKFKYLAAHKKHHQDKHFSMKYNQFIASHIFNRLSNSIKQVPQAPELQSDILLQIENLSLSSPAGKEKLITNMLDLSPPDPPLPSNPHSEIRTENVDHEYSDQSLTDENRSTVTIIHRADGIGKSESHGIFNNYTIDNNQSTTSPLYITNQRNSNEEQSGGPPTHQFNFPNPQTKRNKITAFARGRRFSTPEAHSYKDDIEKQLLLRKSDDNQNKTTHLTKANQSPPLRLSFVPSESSPADSPPSFDSSPNSITDFHNQQLDDISPPDFPKPSDSSPTDLDNQPPKTNTGKIENDTTKSINHSDLALAINTTHTKPRFINKSPRHRIKKGKREAVAEDGEESMPLTAFYPPLPSYEDEEFSSPSYHDTIELLLLGPSPELINENKLSEHAQMMLHSSDSSIANSFTSPSYLSINEATPNAQSFNASQSISSNLILPFTSDSFSNKSKIISTQKSEKSNFFSKAKNNEEVDHVNRFSQKANNETVTRPNSGKVRKLRSKTFHNIAPYTDFSTNPNCITPPTPPDSSILSSGSFYLFFPCIKSV